MKKTYLILLLLFSVIITQGQIIPTDASTNFYDFITKYYNLNPSLRNDTTPRNGRQKDFDRLAKIWGPRLYPHGNCEIAANAIYNYTLNFNNLTKSAGQYDNVNWSYEGPVWVSNTGNQSGNLLGTGQIHRITFDPQYNGGTNKTIYASTSFGGLYKSTNDGEYWNILNTDHLSMATVADIAIDYNNSNNLFIATGYADCYLDRYYCANTTKVNPISTIGMYRSLDAGNNWVAINEGFFSYFEHGGVTRRIISDPLDGNKLYAATTEGIFKTDNALNSDPSLVLWNRVLTVDGGIADQDRGFRGLEFKPGDPNTVYASGKDIYKTTNGGINWTSMTGPGTGLEIENLSNDFSIERINIAVTPADPNRLYAYLIGNTPNNYLATFYIYMYKDLQWHQIWYEPTYYTAAPWIAIAASPVDANQLFFGTSQVHCIPNVNSNPITLNTVTGNSPEGFHADVHALVFQPNMTSPKLYCGHHGGISVKSDTGITVSGGWEYRNLGLNNATIWSFDVSSENEDVYIVGNQDNGVDISRVVTGNNVWFYTGYFGDGYGAQIGNDKTNHMFFKVGGGCYSYDYNNSVYYGEESRMPETFQIENYPDATHKMLFTSWQISNRSETYSNPTWTFESDIIPPTNTYLILSEFKIAPSNPNYIYAISASDIKYLGGIGDIAPRFYRSTTGLTGGQPGPQKFTEIELPKTTEFFEEPYTPVVTGIAVSPTNPQKVWITFCGYEGDYKVWRSTDAGDHWVNADPNHTLNALPVNGIVYQEGTNDRLFIATDAGIFVKDDSDPNSDWEKYGDIPNVRVVELRINQLNNTLVAATFGRGIWQADLPCIEKNNVPLEITSNTSWDRSKTVLSDVVVKNNSTLTITARVNFPATAKIIIEAGSKLIVDAGTLTNGCSEGLWGGIEVQGNPNQPQYDPQYQGYVELKNGAIIENAAIGVHCVLNSYIPNKGAQTYYASGGIIIANGATFRNNATAINIEQWNSMFNNYVSTIMACTFEYPKLITGVSIELNYIKLTGLKGVYIWGNNFNGNTSNDYQNRGIGLEANDATFNLYNNAFNNLYYGIKCMNTNTIAVPVITYHTFTDCYRGIYLSGVTNPTVTFNTMTVPSDNNNCYGLYLDNCPTFNVQENSFTGTSSGNGDFGIIINNCGETSKKIYNNVFTNINIGTQAQNQNKNASGSTGLQILCNTYTNTSYDIKVMSNQAGFIAGIAQYQGRPGPYEFSPAGNLFSHNTMDYSNSLRPNVTYYHHDPISNPYVMPNPISGNITLTNTNIQWSGKSICCPSEFTEDIGDIAGLKSSIGSSQNQVNITKIQLQTLVDGGNTTILETQVENSPPSQALQLRNKLLGTSPYLSDSVMVSAIDNEDGLPPSMLTQVLVQNPSGAKSPDVLDKLDSRVNPLPEYMMQEILAGQNRLSDKEKLETKVCYYTLQRDMAWDKIARIYKNDSIHPWANDSLMALLCSDPRLMAKYELVFARFAKDQDNEAMLLLGSLPQNYQMDESQTEEYNDYVVLAGICANLKENNKTWQEMSNEQKQALQLMANKQMNTADMFAVNIMHNIDNYTYNEPILLDGVGGGKMLFGIGASNTNQPGSSDIQFKVYPNPANNYFLIDYLLIDETTNAKIEIVDISGKILKSIKLNDQQNQLVIETKGIINGIYFVYLIDNGAIMKQAKLTIIN